MPENTIVVAEDDKKIADILIRYLQNEGYETVWIKTGNEVISFIKKNHPLLLLLDIMLPEMDGISICKELRTFSNIPVLMVTAKVNEVDRLMGLDIGADDYICKPFSPKEVIARIKAVLRRYNIHSAGNTKHTNIYIQTESKQLVVYGNTIDLTPYEFSLLELLFSQPGTIFSRAKLIKQVQGYQYEGYQRTIDVHIKNLRKKNKGIFTQS